MHIHSETIMSVNGISNQTLNPTQYSPSSTSSSSRDQKIEELLHEIEDLLMQGDSGDGDDSTVGSDSDNNPPAGNRGATNNAAVPAGNQPGQGLHDVKLNTKAGGEALHLQEDSQGNLYNGSGNSVGVVDKNGNVTLNSGATKELQRLETGGSHDLSNFANVGKRGAGGNIEFTADEVTVSAGDLNQKNDF
ncbi:hypothetical protein WT08_15030 [Burkholderia sp. MSMB1552]|nr:hypothetical protein WT08_15030 [Burkholderia sp. MSMB1552]KWZ51517.1 hypothetical protein WS92_24340 [Burkholderia sp. MSMB1588]